MEWRRSSPRIVQPQPAVSQRIPWHDAGDTRNIVVCPLHLFAFSILNFSLSIHTRLTMKITIRTVWANRVLPDDAGQICTRQISTGQISPMEVDAG